MHKDQHFNKEYVLEEWLSGQEHRILQAAHDIAHNCIVHKDVLTELHPLRQQMEDIATPLDFGGMILPNKRFVDKALQLIKESVERSCLCSLLFEPFNQNGHIMTQFGFQFLSEDYDTDFMAHECIIQCPVCHQKYKIEEYNTGWHMTSTVTTPIND